MSVPTLDYESLFRSVVESVGDLVVSTDADGAILTWNAAAEEATGYAAARVCGSRLADHVEEPRNQEVDACLREMAETCSRRSVEWPLRRRNGGSAPVSWRLWRMTGKAGEVVGFVAVGRASVDWRLEAEQLRQGEKLAALGMVIGGIAHEIRRPLGVSSAAAQLMRDKSTSPALLEECIGKVIGGIDRAALVIESLLRFARPGPITTTTPVDVLDVVENALTLASDDAAPETAIEWRLPPASEQIYAEGAPNLLELVVVNLIQNAFQAMPDGGRLTICVFRDCAEVVIEIGDTGPGIPEAHLSKIFDPFFTTRSDSRRSGLGLSVSHSIIRQHGGSVSVRSSPGRGATFVVRVPVAREGDRGRACAAEAS